MSDWNGNLTNEDGLVVRFDTTRGTAITDGITQGQQIQMARLYIDSQNLTAIADAVAEDVARLPEHALVIHSHFVAESAWTGTGTLDIGVAKSDGTALDADGLHPAIDVDVELAAAGDTHVGDGVLADGTDIITEDAWLYATAGGTVSAGVGTLYVQYILTKPQ